jgi:glycosyltransferase involved in cell wall biosynthesis
MEKYSVLMSVYIGEKADFLRQSLNSIFCQTVTPSQFVLVKNGPLNKELEDIISFFDLKYPKILDFVSHNENLSLGKALDSGIALCRNELVARMDSDDISNIDRCEKLLNRFAMNSKLEICGSYMNEFYNDNPFDIRTSREVPVDLTSIKKYIRRRNPFNHPTVMFKKSSVIRCGGYGTSRRREDFELFSKMINMGCIAENIPEALVNFRANLNSFKRKKSWMYCSDNILVMKRNVEFGYSNLFDFFVVLVYSISNFLMPISFSIWITNNFLRKKRGKK